MCLRWKNKDKNLLFSELIKSYVKNVFCIKSQVYVLNLISGGGSTMKKAGKSEHTQLQVLMSNSK